MRIGYACTPITIDAKNSRSFMLKNFSYEKFMNLQIKFTGSLFYIKL